MRCKQTHCHACIIYSKFFEAGTVKELVNQRVSVHEIIHELILGLVAVGDRRVGFPKAPGTAEFS